MPSRSPRRKTLATAAACCALALALYAAPTRFDRSLRGVLLDAIVGGQSFMETRIRSWPRTGADLPADRLQRDSHGTAQAGGIPNEESTLSTRCRRLTLENARLREELRLAETYGVSPLTASRNGPKEAPVVIRADVVSRETLTRWRTVRQLAGGTEQGVAESSFVLDADEPHIDRGSEVGIEPELDVFIGRCVVGRIASVGRWTSTLELITDPRYRGLAQIVRPSEQGASFGTEGILVGTGTSVCKLTDVPTTQSVRPGDEVYTSDRDSRTPVPLYYGQIVRVEEAGRCWDIVVRPAVKPAELRSVAVLKTVPFAGRPLAE